MLLYHRGDEVILMGGKLNPCLIANINAKMEVGRKNVLLQTHCSKHRKITMYKCN